MIHEKYQRDERENKEIFPKRPLETFFSPKSVVIFGATDQLDRNGEIKLGQRMTQNITESFSGKTYFVNPGRETVFGEKCYKTAAELPEVPELAVVVTPAKATPDITRQCAEAGIPSTVILSAGFGEGNDEEGKKLAEEVKTAAKNGKGTRIDGPNCFGVVGPELNATFSRGNPSRGNMGVISQSGGVLAGFLDTKENSEFGISRAVSSGAMLDVTWKEWLEAFGEDETTKQIVLYMEKMGEDARGFMSSAREISKKKLIAVMKAGRTAESAKAAASHTGSLAGDSATFDEVFRRAGIIRVDNTPELKSILQMSKQPLPNGNRLAMITNGGGPAVIATDDLVLSGGKMAEISPETIEALNETLPPTWSKSNPMDVIGDATPKRYRDALEAALADSENDGVHITYVPVAMSSPSEIAETIVAAHQKYPKKPVFASFTGEKSEEDARAILAAAGIPVFDSSEDAARAFGKLSQRAKWLKENSEKPRTVREDELFERTEAENEADASIRGIRESGRTILTEHEAKEVFRAYGIPANETFIGQSPEEAVEIAEKIGYPVVLKLNSKTLTHKTDVSGVELNLRDAESVRSAFLRIKESVARVDPVHFEGVNVQKMEKLSGEEILLGAKTDPDFGHIVLFGAGGTRAEFYADTAVSLTPLNTALAKAMISRTKISKILEKGWRGSKPANMEKIENIIVSFSKFLESHPEVKEVDINPLLASEDALVALDARIILHEMNEKIPESAIRPFPAEYAWSEKDKTSAKLLMRPIRAEDEDKLAEFYSSLSDASASSRYGAAISRQKFQSHEFLAELCQVDYDRDMRLIATDGGKIVGVGDLQRIPGRNGESEAAFTIADEYQNRGVGMILMQGLIRYAKQEGLEKIVASTRRENAGALGILRKCGFEINADMDGEVSAELKIL